MPFGDDTCANPTLEASVSAIVTITLQKEVDFMISASGV